METDNHQQSSDTDRPRQDIIRTVANYPTIIILYSGLSPAIANGWEVIDVPEVWQNGFGIGIGVAALLHTLRIVLDMTEA